MNKYFHELSGFLRQSAKFIWFAITIFSLGILIGYINPEAFKDLLHPFGEMARKMLRQNMFGLIISIFIKNSFAALISILLGGLLGIIPFLAAILNGIAVGATISSVVKTNGAIVILDLLPHGIFELPAIFISWGLGIWRGVWYFQKGPGKYSYKELRNMSLRIYFSILLPLLFVAAIIEGLGITARLLA